jgi:hypothetical protein
MCIYVLACLKARWTDPLHALNLEYKIHGERHTIINTINETNKITAVCNAINVM